ncbi:NAD(P)H-dependent oxidoreductase [Roseibium aestuarii]|uniref:NAD(P)H-dependent oxidoreductase n=1 Tax=Roseibium aestuarii TaxID=2600299 RepID=A0ABW4JYV8_9HYPH|nr:NAD(P)H-dependent oxidoreductase [Roseibium aestuarii]
MKTLVVYCHPCEESFNASLRDTVLETLRDAGHAIRVRDLYGEAFQPVMSAAERRGYHDEFDNVQPVKDHVEDILWCESLIFVYPTWWYGLPAMLKGWLDRVWVPHVTFEMPSETRSARPKMQHIRKLGVVTTCGASWWLSKVIGEPGRKTLLRGMRTLCHPACKTLYMAHYKMDSSTPQSRETYLAKVRQRLKSF